MADDSSLIRITDGESRASLSSESFQSFEALILEIDPQGALLKSSREIDKKAYIDIKVTLRGTPEVQLCAHAVSCNERGLRIRWTFFNHDDEKRLRSALENYKRHSHSSSGNSGGRRSIKASSESASAPASGPRPLKSPSSASVTPFSDAVEPFASGDGQRVGTRRVLRAGGSTTPADEVVTPFGAPVGVPAPALRHDHPASTPTPAAESLSLDLNDDAPPVTKSVTKDATSSVTSASARNKMIRSDDGRMDIGATIRSNSKTVRASDLAARHDRVRVLNMATIKALILEAVEEAASHISSSISENERKRLLEEAEEGFQERMKSFQSEKMDAEVRSKELVRQLSTAQELLEDERKRQISANQFTMSNVGVQKLDEHFETMLTRSIAAGRVSPQLEEQLKKLFSVVLDQEREKIREKELGAQNAAIVLLEKKISRLSGSLEQTEKERDKAQRMAAVLEKNGGALRNVMEAGIDDDDAEKEKKIALMRVILEDNRKLREALGIKLNKDAPPVADAPTTAAPAADQEAPSASADSEVTTDDSADSSSESGISPDDEPWEIKPLPGINGGMSASGVKQIDVRALLNKEPPPLDSQIAVTLDTGDDASDSDDTTSESGINPDDEPWEIKPLPGITGGVTASGVKQIDVRALLNKEPPPLIKK